MITDNDIIEKMIMRDEMLAEERASMHHEYMMRTDDEYFFKYSEYLEEYLKARDNFLKELRSYNIELKPEDFL